MSISVAPSEATAAWHGCCACRSQRGLLRGGADELRRWTSCAKASSWRGWLTTPVPESIVRPAAAARALTLLSQGRCTWAASSLNGPSKCVGCLTCTRTASPSAGRPSGRTGVAAGGAATLTRRSARLRHVRSGASQRHQLVSYTDEQVLRGIGRLGSWLPAAVRAYIADIWGNAAPILRLLPRVGKGGQIAELFPSSAQRRGGARGGGLCRRSVKREQ